MSQNRSDNRHHTASRAPVVRRHISTDPEQDPAEARAPASRWSTRTITAIGIAVSAVVTLAAAFGPRLLDRTEVPAPTSEARDGNGDPFGALEPFSSLTHLSALVTLVDPDELDSTAVRPWVVNTQVSSPSGVLELQVPQSWSALDDAALPSGVDGQLLIGWSQPEGYGFVDGGEPGISLASIEIDDPADALDELPSPSKTCPTSAARILPVTLDPGIGTAAVRVLHDCKEQDGDGYVWFQLALALVPVVDDDGPPSTDVLTMSLTSPEDLAAMAQILASMQVSSPERGLGPSGAR